MVFFRELWLHLVCCDAELAMYSATSAQAPSCMWLFRAVASSGVIAERVDL
jgi:hypothetical protein